MRWCSSRFNHKLKRGSFLLFELLLEGRFADRHFVKQKFSHLHFGVA
jgi:hypothetical protein